MLYPLVGLLIDPLNDPLIDPLKDSLLTNEGTMLNWALFKLDREPSTDSENLMKNQAP